MSWIAPGSVSSQRWEHRAGMHDSKFSLIDLDAAMQTRRKMNNHRERLSERTPRTGDAIVCSASNVKMQKSAEMTDSADLISACNKKVDGLALPVGGY